MNKKLLYFDLEHGSQTIGSKKDFEQMFGFPELESSKILFCPSLLLFRS